MYTRNKQHKILATAIAIAAAATILPARAQTTAPQSSEQYQQPQVGESLRTIATALNARRGEAFRRKNSAAVAETYAPNAVYVELLPALQVMRGRAEIQRHFDELLAAQSTDLSFTVTSAEMTGGDTMSVGGDYVLTARGNRKINGHFFQILRREGGAWKIALHTFARPDPVTVSEENVYRGN
jgi:ketosteroid isomerase-like protein